MSRKRRDVFSALASFSSSDDDERPVKTCCTEPASSCDAVSSCDADSSQQPTPTPIKPYAVEGYVASDYDFVEDKKGGVEVDVPILPKRNSSISCGTILTHCRLSIDKMLERFGGERAAVFKIGIATSLIPRRTSYINEGYIGFRCIMCSLHLPLIEMAEAACIALYEGYKGNAAIRTGGDGGLGKRTHYLVQSGSPVFFLYIAANTCTVSYPLGKHRSHWSQRHRDMHTAELKLYIERHGKTKHLCHTHA